MGRNDRPVRRVERSFSFIDISGFTAFTETEGDDQAVAMLGRFRRVVRDVASSRGVRVAKWLGDGAMLVAIDLTNLLEAVTDIGVDAERDDIGIALPIRAGVAHGPVILMEGDDHIGTPVNLAARLCDEAQPNEVLAPEWVLDRPLPANTVSRPVGARKVRGIAQPVELVRLEPS
ncbi:MAG: adenylate/guanylate cyclase domain-containing protein [Acidimicrobiales bacterium]